MLKEQTDFDALGAEALLGGLADILRTLQPTPKPALWIRTFVRNAA